MDAAANNDERAPFRPTPLVVLVAGGVLVGAGLGVLELGAVMDPEDPSVARRTGSLLRFAMIEYGVAGALLALAGGLVLRLAARALPGAVAGRGAGLLFAQAVGFAVFGWLVVDRALEHALEPHGARLGWLLGFAGLGLLATLVVGVALARLRGSRAARVGERALRLSPLAGLAAVVVVAYPALSRTSGPDAEQPSPTPEQVAAARPDVVLVVIDTLRADVVGAYGGDAETPVLDRLAARGVLFERPVAPCSWTLPSMASLFSSQLPGDHGLVDFAGLVRDDLDLLPEVLAAAGYSCRAVVANELMSTRRGFDRGFELYDVYGYECEGALSLSRLFDGLLLLAGPRRGFGPAKRPFLHLSGEPPFLWTRMTHYLYDEDVTARVRDHALAGAGQAPLFLYVHYFGPHSPYLEHPFRFLPDQPEFEPENTGLLWERYLGEVAHTDAMLGELLDTLPARFDDALVIVTSDHGEEFREHGRWLHGNGLYEEAVRVPLVVAGPSVAPGQTVDHPVSLIDVAPTILDLVGVTPPAGFHGESLRGFLAGAPAPRSPERVVSELLPKNRTAEEVWHAVYQGTRKAVRRAPVSGGAPAFEVYDLAADPAERVPGEARPADAGLVELLDERALRQTSVTLDELSEEDLQSLKALGYVDE